MKAKRSKPLLSAIPWMSYGRAESFHHLWEKCAQQRHNEDRLVQRPLFSIVLIVNASSSQIELARTIESVTAQSYQNWEVWVGSTAVDARWIVEAVEEIKDPRMKGIRGATTVIESKKLCAEAAQGEWLGWIESGDILSPAALFDFAAAISANPSLSLFYCNEVQLTPSMKKVQRAFSKPEMSWFNLLHFNYIGRFWLAKKSLWNEIKGFSHALGEAHERGFFLSAIEKGALFGSIPAFHYYHSHPFAHERGDELPASFLQAHLKFREIEAVVVSPKGIEPVVQGEKILSVVVCFRNEAEITIRAIQHLARIRTQAALELILVDNHSSFEERERVERAARGLGLPMKLFSHPGPFNFAYLNNQAVRDFATGEFVLFLNNDVFLDEKVDLNRWIGWASQEWVGTVGIHLFYPDGKNQHSGFCAIPGGRNRMVFVEQTGNRGFELRDRECFGSSFAACMVRRKWFLERGGLEEVLYPNAGGDLAFSLECLKEGKRNLYLGTLSGMHLQSKSRGTNYEYWEERAIEKKYAGLLQQMLRNDLGYDRTPSLKQTIKNFVRDLLGGFLSHPTWRPLKALFLHVPLFRRVASHA